jgi:signal transduction histidine kinase
MLEPIQLTLGWGFGAAILGGFALVLRHERRQARRLVERSKELERLSSELLRVNKMKSEFLANVSHELRTPLNAIVGFVDLLREGVYGELTPRQAGPVQRIEASATHLRHLVDQILDLAKMAAGRLEVHSESIDLRPLVLDITSEIEPLVTEKKLHVSLAIGASLPRVRTDPTHLRQILVNLIGNAVKYTENGGIVVRTRMFDADDQAVPEPLRHPLRAVSTSSSAATRPWIALQVIDTGIGIAPADHVRIFEEFEQVTAGARGDSINRGTGLGLPISRRLARLLGGDVTLESASGKGSTFTVWLPGEPAQS